MSNPTLPVDIFPIIILHLADDTPSLRDLFLCNHRLRSLVEPWLYRTVELHTHARLENFQSTIAKNHRLTRYVHSLWVPSTGEIHRIFPSFVNLRRLAYTTPTCTGPSPETVFKLLGNVNLTHLNWSVSVGKVKEFFRFLEAQPLLEHLETIDILLTPQYGPCPMPTLSPNALPHLQSLEAYAETALLFLPGRAVQHLSLMVQDREDFSSKASTFSTVKTLSFPIYDLSSVQFLPIAKYIQVIGNDLTLEETMEKFKPAKCCKLRWPNVEYISFVFEGEYFGERGELRPSEDLVDPLRQLPKLKTVDIVFEWAPTEFEFFRYQLSSDQRGLAQPQIIERDPHHRGDWRMWWEFCGVPPP